MPKTQTYHLHLPHLNFDHSRELNLLYAVRTARELSNRLVMFYIPLFLYKHGQTVFAFLDVSEMMRGMLMIALMYFLMRLCQFLFGIAAGKAINKIGLQRSFVVANIFYTLSLALYQLSAIVPWLVFFIPITDGVQVSFFWPSYHTILSKNAHKTKVGKDLGAIQFLLNLMAMISPAIGGGIIAYLGYGALFSVGLIVVLFGVIFSLMMKTTKIRDKISWAEFKSWLSEKTYRRLAVSFAGRYANDATRTLWPLYVFLILGSVEKVGYLYTFSIFLAMIVSYFIGSFIDKHKSKRPFFLSGGLLSISWIVKSQIANIWSIALVDTFDRLTSNFHGLFFDRVWMIRGKGKEALSYFVYREMILSITGMIFWVVFLAIFIVFASAWTALFMFAALGVMMSLLIKQHKT